MGISQPVTIVGISQLVSPYGGAVSPSYILDNYSINAAYSIRKLTNKTTPILRVRRSNDNAEQDVYTPQEALSFCGANTGFVTTWYDQGPNNRHAVQTVAALQPYICSAGSLFILSGYSAINYHATAYLSATIPFATSGTKFGALSTTNRFDTNNRTSFGSNTGSIQLRNGANGVDVLRSNVALVITKTDNTFGLKISSIYYTGTTTKLKVNNLIEASTTTEISATSSILRIGCGGTIIAPAEYLNSTMADCIFLNNSDAYPALHQAYLNLYGVV